MKETRIILITIISLIFSNCTTEKHKFPIEKRYWDALDYAEVIRELRYGYESDEKLPTFNDPSKRVIVEKLTDQENFSIVLDDKELGLKHRNNVAETFFMRWKDMQNIYQATNRKDEYLYDIEMITVWQFGLGLQLKYFKLGNDNIKENSDDPNSSSVKYSLNSNIKTLIKNYQIYLDEINNEKALSKEGKILFSEGIDKYFIELVETYPNSDYRNLLNKIELMIKKTKSEDIKKSLNNLKLLIESKE